MILPVRKSQVLSRPDGFLADVIHPALENVASRTSGHLPSGSLPGEIDRRRRLAVLAVWSWPKSNSGFELRRHLDDRGERPAHLAAETLQRPDCACCVINFSISSLSNCRPATIFQSAKSHFWHWNFL